MNYVPFRTSGISQGVNEVAQPMRLKALKAVTGYDTCQELHKHVQRTELASIGIGRHKPYWELKPPDEYGVLLELGPKKQAKWDKSLRKKGWKETSIEGWPS